MSAFPKGALERAGRRRAFWRKGKRATAQVRAGEQAALSGRLRQSGRSYQQMTAVPSNNRGIRGTSQIKADRLNHNGTGQRACVVFGTVLYIYVYLAPFMMRLNCCTQRAELFSLQLQICFFFYFFFSPDILLFLLSFPFHVNNGRTANSCWNLLLFCRGDEVKAQEMQNHLISLYWKERNWLSAWDNDEFNTKLLAFQAG